MLLAAVRAELKRLGSVSIRDALQAAWGGNRRSRYNVWRKTEKRYGMRPEHFDLSGASIHCKIHSAVVVAVLVALVPILTFRETGAGDVFTHPLH